MTEQADIPQNHRPRGFASERRAAVLVLSVLLLVICPASIEGSPTVEARDEIRDLIKAGDYTTAEVNARELLTRVTAEHGASSLQAAVVLDVLVESLWRGGKSDAPETLRLAQQSVAIKERELGAQDAEVATSLRNLGTVLEYSGDPNAAETIYRRAVEIRLEALGPDAPDLAVSYIDLANLLLSTERYDEAGSVYEKTLKIQQEHFGADHPNIAYTLQNMGILHHELGHFETARSF